MREANCTVSSMHGEMPQKERDAIMEDMRQLHDIEQYYSTQIEEMPMNIAELV
jgi:superfamily II DNA/RNA helicase